VHDETLAWPASATALFARSHSLCRLVAGFPACCSYPDVSHANGDAGSSQKPTASPSRASCVSALPLRFFPRRESCAFACTYGNATYLDCTYPETIELHQIDRCLAIL